MKRFALAATLILSTGVALAQAPAAATAPAADVPKAKCEPKPEFPGRLAMQTESRRKLFQREFNTYKDCMSAYVASSQAMAKAYTDAGNNAVNEYNETAKKVNDAQKAASD
jgi:hypothetical protein